MRAVHEHLPEHAPNLVSFLDQIFPARPEIRRNRNWTLFYQLYSYGQVENAEVRIPKNGNGSTETEVRKWEEKPPIGI